MTVHDKLYKLKINNINYHANCHKKIQYKFWLKKKLVYKLVSLVLLFFNSIYRDFNLLFVDRHIIFKMLVRILAFFLVH